jgi:hypothetical protein
MFVLLVHRGTAQPDASLFRSDSLLSIVPFTDHSGFKGKWNIGMDVPRFTAVYLKERFRIGIVPPQRIRAFAETRSIDSSVAAKFEHLKTYAEKFRTRYLITAEITEFSVSRFTVSEMQLAGYESFAADVSLRFVLYDAALFGSSRSPVVYEGEAAGNVKDRGLGITLFGKQTERTDRYFSLDELSFGSEAFNQTIIGSAMLKCMDDLGTKLERAIPSLVSRHVVLSSSVVLDSVPGDPAIALKRQLVNGDIVMVDGDDVFINIGSQDGIAVGDVLPVFGRERPITDPATGASLGMGEERLGEVQVIEIRAEHLCLATIVSGKGSIEPKHRVRKVFVR